MSFILNLSIFLCKFHCYYVLILQNISNIFLLSASSTKIKVYNLTSEGDLDFQVDLSRRDLSQRTTTKQTKKYRHDRRVKSPILPFFLLIILKKLKFNTISLYNHLITVEHAFCIKFSEPE